MPTMTRREIISPPGYSSQEVGSFIAQLDDQLSRLHESTRDLTPEALMWQPAPGMNTIGMLLAHVALVEVWWTKVALKQDKSPDVFDVLGIGTDDDGMPLPEGAAPFALLHGKDLAFYGDLLAKAREYLKRMTQEVPDEALEREIQWKRPDGSDLVLTIRWYLYHLLEHFAGHFGQILLLQHLRRAGIGERSQG